MKTVKYIWQVAYAHTIAYFLAGSVALVAFNYRELFATDIISTFMLSLDEPVVALGLSLQIFRGIIIALIMLPLRKVFFEEKHGLLKLGLIIIGFSLLSTIGPTSGSFEGYIFTKIPYMYQIWGYPEAIIYVLLFIGILKVSIKYEHKKIIAILSIIMVLLIILMGIMGFMAAKGYLNA
ncbi:MAG: hypothetical protein LBL04_10590 [Bacteroidales bacterium]|jgi:hypothetical protein|nr:hypothetical protein [Bacteroidales bacterium]